jgi:CRP/FNR family transcriptional regulator
MGTDLGNAKIEGLQKTALFKGLTADELTPLLSRSNVVDLKAGEILFLAGDPSTGLFVVLNGRTRAFRHSPDGREQIIHEDEPGSTFPEVSVFDDGPYPSSVVAVEDSQLLSIPKEEVRRFCLLFPQVALAALAVLSRRLRNATGMVEHLALREVTQRLAEYLLNRLQTNRTGKEFELDHTNQEIADLIGSVREVVSRGFARLQKHGWIEKRGRRVVVVDEPGLSAYVHGDLD